MAMLYRKIHSFRAIFLLCLYDLKVVLGMGARKGLRKTSLKNDPKFNAVYFTCRKDFEYLLLSLRSLERLNLDGLENVYLYSDKRDPLSEEQVSILRKELTLDLVPRTTKYKTVFGAWGPELVISELEAYKEIANRLECDDYVFKVDSDVLFISDKIFKEVKTERKGAIGSTEGKRRAFMQGAIYFLKASLVYELKEAIIFRCVLEASQDWDNVLWKVPEDRAISYIIENIGYHLDLKKITVDTLTQSRECESITISRNDMNHHSTIHFASWSGLKKSQMAEGWEWLCSDREKVVFPSPKKPVNIQ